MVALTGAGVSAESGVPTFRGEDGLWKNYRAEEIATPEAFASNPKLVWEWYNWRRDLIGSCQPNPAHHALAKLHDAPFGFTLVTQNVDGLHAKAGSMDVLEVHGCLWRIRCDSCGHIERNEIVPLPEPPLCGCGSPLRPDVVWFGEQLDPVLLSSITEALSRADVMIVAGTSSVVYPAASFADYASRAGAKIIEINLDPTPLTSRADLSLQGRAGDILPSIVEALL